MDLEAFAKTRIGGVLIRALGAGMESRFRYRFFPAATVLGGLDDLTGQVVLEVGCGTGYFTIPTARLIGERGLLVAMDVLSGSVAMVSAKVRAAGLNNVYAVRGDVLNTGFGAGEFDIVLLFGVIPAPMLPLRQLLPEMSRVLKPGGTLAVWPSIPGWLPNAVVRSGLFEHTGKRSGVQRFRRD